MKGSKMKKMKKRILAALLCTTMMLNTGVSAMADGGTAVSSESAHVHTEECYEKSKTDNLICTEAEAAEGHVHGDECYEVTSTPELTCTQAETAGHIHGDSCMETTKNLICGKEEHTHGGDCYKTETRDVCSDESEEHTCGDGCVETEEVLTCTAEEHTHADGCYEVKTNIVCGQDEVEAHSHGEGCYTTVENKTLKCTLEEAEVHTHGDDCYAWEDKLVCTLPETAPAAEQPEKEEKAEEAAEVNLQNDDETGIKVSVKSTSDVIPEDTKVVVAPMEMDEEHETALAEAVGEFEVLGYTAYDISLKDAEDEDITLGENKVEVAIDFEELIPEGINAEEVKDVVLVHITTDEEEKLTAKAVGTVEITEEKATVEFEADSFSPYVVTYLSEIEEAVEEPYVQVLSYEDEDVQIFVEAKTADAIPKNASLKVVPILPNSEETGEQYKSVEEELLKKAEDEEYEIAGFLAYDITFIDVDGNEIEPNGNVKVSMEYKKAVIPESVISEEFEELDVTVMHFEEDEEGEVKEVVDMVAEEDIEAEVKTTEKAEVEKAEFVTDSFSTYTITWKWAVTTLNLNAQVVDVFGEAIEGMSNITITPNLEENEEYVFAEKCEAISHNSLTYNFVKAMYSSGGSFLTAQEIYSVYGYDSWANDRLKYRTSANEEGKDVGTGTVYLVYEALSLYSVTANMVDLSGQILGTKTIRLNENEIYTISNVGNAEINGDDYTYISSYVLDGETRIDIKSLLYKDNKYYYVDEFGDEIELTTKVFLEYAAPGSISYDIVDMQENVLETGKTLNISYGETYKLSKLDYMTIGGTRYTFSSAYIVSSENKITVKDITYNEGKYFYTNSNGELVEIGSADKLYVKYRKPSDELTTIETLDHSDDGIVIKLQNYGNIQSTKNNFMNIGGGYTDGSIHQNRVKPLLNANGYPVTVTNNTSLAPIFGGTGSIINGSLDGSARQVNHLFSKEIYEETGYYEYSSFENYAYLDQSTNNFIVYEQIGTPNKTGDNIDKLYLRGNFLPYNNITVDNVSTDQYNSYDEDGIALKEGDHRYREPLYEVASPDFYFGMSMEATFIQPRDGYVTWKGTTSPMKYEFNGDDDLWVFIDGVLVLDLGGIHVAHRGYIDFVTGEIYIDKSAQGAKPTFHGYLSEVFAEAFKDAGWSDAAIDQYLAEHFTGNTFKNYTQHELKMFYMERGDGASDLHVKFNLPTIPKNAVTIQKEISNYTTGAYSDVEFSFNMYLENETTGNYELVPERTAYTHVSADGKETPATVEANGVFKLKHNEKAVFKEITAGRKYYVKEIGLDYEEYDIVEIIGSGIINESGTSIDEDQSTIQTKKLTVGTDSFVLFQNRCAASNMKHIYIDKVLNGGTAPNDKYSVKVTVAGKPYTGEYKIVAKNQDASMSDKVLTAGSNGIITLKANQRIVLLGYAVQVDENDNVTKQGIPSGTTFKVEEVNLKADKYKEPVYTVTEVKDETGEVVNGYSGYATGVVDINKANAIVTIANTIRTSQLTITKQFVTSKGNVIAVLPEDLHSIRLVIQESYEAENENDSDFTYEHELTLEKNEQGVFVGTLTNVQSYTDFKVTLEEMLNEEGKVIENAADWRNYSFTWTRPENASGSVELDLQGVLTNTLDLEVKTQVTVNKQWNDNNNRWKTRPDKISVSLMKGNETVYEPVELTSDNGWTHTFTGLPKYNDDGTLITYTVRENEVPAGYISQVNGTTVTNTLDIQIIKRSSSNDELFLEGAIFKLQNDNYVYYAESEADGMFKWYTTYKDGQLSNELNLAIENGTYTLSEEKAPAGYAVSAENWTVEVNNGVFVSVKDDSGEFVDAIPLETENGTIYAVYFENTALYELPSSGGHGIYTTMLSGFALMLGAAYVWFASRREESFNN